jgi:hypothetical protein
VNIANLVDKWTSVAKLPSATQLAVREARAIQHGQPLPMHVDVSSRRGSGSPSGDFSLVTVNPGHSTATLSVAGSAKPGSTTDLTVVVGGGPSNPHIGTPGQELGQIEYLDSIDGAPAQLLGGAPQTLTVGNQNTSVNIFPVTLQSGHHIITARFLGTADWTPAQSNSITLAIGKSNNSAVAGGKGE